MLGFFLNFTQITSQKYCINGLLFQDQILKFYDFSMTSLASKS